MKSEWKENGIMEQELRVDDRQQHDDYGNNVNVDHNDDIHINNTN